MKKNVASQSIGGELITASDGSAFTGTVTVYVTGDAGTQALGSVGSGVCTHEGNGYHTYAPAQAETNYDQIAFTFIGSGAVPATVQVFTSFPQTVDNATAIATAQSDLDKITGSDGATLATTQGNYAPNKVVPDAAGTAPTATEVVNEWETQSQADPTGFHVNVKEVNGTGQTANDNGADINTILSRIIGTLASGTHNPATAAQIAVLSDWINGGRLDLIQDIIAVDTTTDIPALIATAQADLDKITGSDGATLATAQGNYAPAKAGDNMGTVSSVTGNVAGNVTGSVGSNLELGPSEVNAEVVDAINVDTYAEPGQGAPAATTSLVAKINYLYKAWRNKTEQTATTLSIYNDAGSVVDQKATVSDAAGTATNGEIVSGP